MEGEDLQACQKNMASTFFLDITIKCTLRVTTTLYHSHSEEVLLKGNVVAVREPTTHYVVHEAIEFIRANKDRLFRYMPITPHGIFIPDDDPAWAIYKDKIEWPEQARRYAAMVGMIDRQAGRF